MICPNCNIEMTRHAVKFVHPRDASDVVDPDLGGVVVERHTCPGCGSSGSTRPGSKQST